MSDLIERQAAIDVAKQHWYKPDIAKALEELPSAQHKVIRCKDCKFYTAYDYTGKLMCKRIGKGMILPKPEDYCSYAERMTDESD